MEKRVEIYTKEDKVVLEIDGMEGVLFFNPELAVQIGKTFIDAAVDIGAEVEIQIPPRKISTLLRNQMIQRTTHIMRTLQSSKPCVVAMHIVDSVLGML